MNVRGIRPSRSSNARGFSPDALPAAEERINIASHAAGLLLSVAGLVALVTLALRHGDAWHLVSFSIYGPAWSCCSLPRPPITAAAQPARRARLRTADHASIYLLIAGTYTPFALVT
jgi:hemolysin III